MRLLEALAAIPSERRPVLVLPGYATPHEHELRERATRLGLAADTRFLGWVTDEELEGLYRSAACFVFPSLYEGFGLPVLEAMARGVPVACSDRGALAEVIDGAAVTFDPDQPQAIADAIERLLVDAAERDRLSGAGRANAARFHMGGDCEANVADLRAGTRVSNSGTHALTGAHEGHGDAVRVSFEAYSL